MIRLELFGPPGYNDDDDTVVVLMMVVVVMMMVVVVMVEIKNMLSWRREPFLFSICLSQTLPTSKHLGLSHFVSNLYS